MLGETWVTDPAMDPETKAGEDTIANVDAIILISPRLWGAPLDVLSVLLHEMCHTQGRFGHGGAFAELAEQVGLVRIKGVWAGLTEERVEFLQDVIEGLPPFPYADIQPADLAQMECGGGEVGNPAAAATMVPVMAPIEPPQKGRYRLHECPCKQKIRAARDDAFAMCLKCNRPFVLVVKGAE